MKKKSTVKLTRYEDEQELLRDRAERLALSTAAVSDDDKRRRSTKDYVVFNLGGDIYALESAIIKEVYESDEILSVPCTPEFLRGVISVRGNIWAVVDLCVFFGSAKSVALSSSKVLLVSVAEKELGIIIDEVIDVIPIPDSELKPLTVGEDSPTRYVLGVTNDRKTILDGRMLINDESFVVNEFVGNI